MSKGIELFREKFAAHTDRYVLIGGTACELALQAAISAACRSSSVWKDVRTVRWA